MSSRSVVFAVAITAVAVTLAACGRKESYQLMASTPRYEPLEPSEFFPDGASAREPVPGTVPRGAAQQDALLTTGLADGAESPILPFPATRAVLGRGRDRFDIYCSPCHARTGYGDGMIVQRGFLRPPSLHDDVRRGQPVGHFFRVMTLGFGAMPSYAKQISVDDRWAIAAYIRALQTSQHARLDDVPAARRAELDAGGGRR
jgi:mono/diheme cytochrome c family protein